MKTLKYLLLTGVLSLIIYSCTMTKSNINPSQNLNKKWMLVEFQDFSKEDLIHLNAYLDLTKQQEVTNRFAAKMGCNGMFFTSEFNNKGKVKFSDVASTMMMCDDKAMKLEDAFSKELPTLTQYKIEGHFLILSNSKGEIMKFVAEDWD